MKVDLFGKNCSELLEKKLFLFDMDGTIYEEDKVFDGTIELLNNIKESGHQYVFITNNSSKSLDDYIKKVNRLGISADRDNFYTSTQATIAYIQENFKDKLVYCMGTESFLSEMKKNKINITTEVDMSADAVVIGFDTELTSSKLRNTCEMLQKDIPYIATNPDLACPVSFGFIPDCGAIGKMIECATGKLPLYIGKPAPTMVNFVMKKFNYKKEETVVIGDRLYTDIAVGLNAGVTAICVLTGETKFEDLKDSDIKPTFVFESVRGICSIIEKR